MTDTYWLLLLEGAHIEAQRRHRKRIRRTRPVPRRVGQLIDQCRVRQGLDPLYGKKRAS